ncbi:four-carbon acid sugar kinase family protein [Pseudonocardia sp. NPDC049635]|uniref:four-carbon acid sugar kinase family protein n=1 Tax=Pseudonocardia sp. NPDC049635 TaxID=3155506 RepID=UPI0033CEC29A
MTTTNVTKVVVCDDDPTGTQSATGVEVLLQWDTEVLTAALDRADAVYLLTNTRALDESAAVALVRRIRDEAAEVGRRLDADVRLVLRGDSTLRGHVFAECAAIDPRAPVVFAPAFPGGGRTTVEGTHLVRIGGVTVPAHETEFARDPVFGYRYGHLPDYVRERSGRTSVPIGIGTVRSPALAAVLAAAAEGEVLLPDVHDDTDLRLIADALRTAWAHRTLVARGGAPLAAAIAGVTSDGLLPAPVAGPGSTLLVCGSHTAAATRQLERAATGRTPGTVVRTAAALTDPGAETEVVTAACAAALDSGFATLTSERDRLPAHDTLAHGESVMRVLAGTVARLRDRLDVVVTKGGITGAQVARDGLGAVSARVRGQVLPGVSVWDLRTVDGRDVVQVVVPGNVGDDDALDAALATVRA